MNEDPEGISPGETTGAEPRWRTPERSEMASAMDDSPSENHRVKRGGDRQAEGLVVNAREEARTRTTEQSEVVKWETLLARAGCGRQVIAHARAVADLALQVAESPLVNRDLVLAGGMLHDVGRGETHGIDHAQRGAALARSFSLDERVVYIIERHIGAGMTADECSLERIIPRDCIPRTVEEKIVANADNLVHGNRQGTIEGTLEGAFRLKKRIRRRIYRLYLEMECFRS